MRVSVLPFLSGLLAVSTAYVIPGVNPRAPSAGAKHNEDGIPILRPLHIRAFDSAVTGLRPRSTTDFEALKPQDKCRFAYGAPAGNGDVLLANMTLYAPNEKRIVSMELFEGLTKAVDCNGDDGGLSITFLDKAAFDYAIKTWSFINEDVDEQFIIVANHDGCGPDGERQAYFVNEVDNDETKYITYLKASPAKWEDVAGTFDLDFGRASLKKGTGAATKLRRRGRSATLHRRKPKPWWNPIDAIKDGIDAVGDLAGDVVDGVKDGVDAIGDAAGDVVDGVKDGVEGVVDGVKDLGSDIVDKVQDIGSGVFDGVGDVIDDVGGWAGDAVDDLVDGAGDLFEDVKDWGEDAIDAVGDAIEDVVDALVDIELSDSVTFPVALGEPHHNYPIYKGDIVAVDCSNCFIGGSFKVTGTIKMKVFVPTELSIRLAPQDFKAALEVTTSVNLSGSKSGEFSKESKDINLFEVPVPGAGIVIPHIFTLGAVVGIDAGFSVSFNASLSMTLGVNAAIPNTANLVLDLMDLPSSGAFGWDGVSVEPVVDFNIHEATVEGAVYLRPKIALKMEILSLGKAEAAVKMDLPKVSASASIRQDENGVCPGSTDEFGLELKMAASLGLVVKLDASVAGLWDGDAEYTLFSIDLFKQDYCKPFDNPLDGLLSEIGGPPSGKSTPLPLPMPSGAGAASSGAASSGAASGAAASGSGAAVTAPGGWIIPTPGFVKIPIGPIVHSGIDVDTMPSATAAPVNDGVSSIATPSGWTGSGSYAPTPAPSPSGVPKGYGNSTTPGSKPPSPIKPPVYNWVPIDLNHKPVNVIEKVKVDFEKINKEVKAKVDSIGYKHPEYYDGPTKYGGPVLPVGGPISDFPISINKPVIPKVEEIKEKYKPKPQYPGIKKPVFPKVADIKGKYKPKPQYPGVKKYPTASGPGHDYGYGYGYSSGYGSSTPYPVGSGSPSKPTTSCTSKSSAAPKYGASSYEPPTYPSASASASKSSYEPPAYPSPSSPTSSYSSNTTSAATASSYGSATPTLYY